MFEFFPIKKASCPYCQAEVVWSGLEGRCGCRVETWHMVNEGDEGCFRLEEDRGSLTPERWDSVRQEMITEIGRRTGRGKIPPAWDEVETLRPESTELLDTDVDLDVPGDGASATLPPPKATKTEPPDKS